MTVCSFSHFSIRLIFSTSTFLVWFWTLENLSENLFGLFLFVLLTYNVSLNYPFDMGFSMYKARFVSNLTQQYFGVGGGMVIFLLSVFNMKSILITHSL